MPKRLTYADVERNPELMPEFMAEVERLDAIYAEVNAEDEANRAAWIAAHPGPCHEECEGCVECYEDENEWQRYAVDHRGRP